MDTEHALQSLLELCHKKTYPNKSVVVRPGDPGDRLIYITQGSVSVSVEDESGHELILTYLNKGDFIGEIGVFKEPEIRKAMVKTRCQCIMAEISYDRLIHAMDHELSNCAASLLMLFGKQVAARLLITSRKFFDLAFMDVEGRVARTLLDLSKEPDAMTHPDGMQLHITRQEIARIVGCTREMVGRVLKELEEKKLIEAHGKTIVVYGTR
jgi:CRP/FNR family cyclic AMP-dependent transcriptional regulator